jgi:hypothetical protein
MTEMTAEVRLFVEQPNYAHIATLMPDGAPHITGLRSDRRHNSLKGIVDARTGH